MDPYLRSFTSGQGKQDLEVYQNLQEVLPQVSSKLADLDIAEEAVKKTSAITGGTLLGGITPDFSDASKILAGEGVQDTLNFVGQTKGAVSDKEMSAFKSAAFGPGQGQNYNMNKLNAARAILLRKEQQANFFNEWKNNYGTLDGSYEAFAQFANKNPIITKKGLKIELAKPIDEIRADQSYIKYLYPDNSAAGGTQPVVLKPNNTSGFSAKRID
jgi:hypothetical protein